jgi:hypothetical protein
MKLFFWKKNKDIDIFANTIANDLFSMVQPDSINDYFKGSSKDKKIKNNRKKVEANISIVIKKIQQFRAANSLGTYGKARLQLGFSNRLQDLGYNPDVIRKLNEFILVRIP